MNDEFLINISFIFLTQEGGVRALLEICRTESLEFAHCQALRALATISCVAESLFEIEKVTCALIYHM